MINFYYKLIKIFKIITITSFNYLISKIINYYFKKNFIINMIKSRLRYSKIVTKY